MGPGVQESKQKITNIVSLIKMAENVPSAFRILKVLNTQDNYSNQDMVNPCQVAMPNQLCQSPLHAELIKMPLSATCLIK